MRLRSLAQRGRRIRPMSATLGAAPPRRSSGAPRGAPWHFWLVVVMAALYLGWRFVEGVAWLIGWIGGMIG